jgi:hypothetical protein
MDSPQLSQPDAPAPKKKRLLTTRKVFSFIGFVVATIELNCGHISGEEWVYVLIIVIAGHHAEDLVKAWRH